jgi:hypothetical protein
LVLYTSKAACSVVIVNGRAIGQSSLKYERLRASPKDGRKITVDASIVGKGWGRCANQPDDADS